MDQTGHDTNGKWSKERVLAEARSRTAELKDHDKGVAEVQAMLALLITEAGWTEPEFLQALTQDVVARTRKRHLKAV